MDKCDNYIGILNIFQILYQYRVSREEKELKKKRIEEQSTKYQKYYLLFFYDIIKKIE